MFSKSPEFNWRLHYTRIVAPSGVIANYKETQMTRVRVGQTARVTVGAFPAPCCTAT